MIKRGPEEAYPPPYLYKYRHMTSLGLVELFKKREIYLATSTEFNDPFDCKPTVEKPAGATQRRKFIRRSLETRSIKLSRNELRQIDKDAKSQFDKTSVSELMNAASTAINRSGIFSLPSLPDQILMWSHYADSHRGFCLRFRTDRDLYLATARQVKYSIHRPVLNFREDPTEWVKKAALTKADGWSYEKEWHVLVYHEKGMFGLAPECLDAVILGARISKVSEEKILELVKLSKTPIQILRAHFDQQDFRIDLLPAPAT